ncbi:MAG: septal ring lytic transglycosylase RlpA family protein, partial [Candidatus Marinimicrobia bacterium]|nr:septal ring lytic transglycosylase RlpA family protein [Candidatus Neomarinimicrobiota bacterium]
LCLECTPAPRYKAGNGSYGSKPKLNNSGKNKASQKSKKEKSSFNKNKLVYKGVSSYYGPKFHGKLTANGEIFDMYGVTAAHKEFPFNTVARVTNENNGKSLLIRINDRGPYIDGRILDCSFGAAKKLGFVKDGTAPVKIEVVEWGDGEYMHHDY